jgi:hypothetical protein
MTRRPGKETGHRRDGVGGENRWTAWLESIVPWVFARISFAAGCRESSEVSVAAVPVRGDIDRGLCLDVDLSRGITRAAVSKVRLGELYEDVRADYRNRGQRLDILETRWTHIEDFFGPNALAKTITDTRMQHYIDMRRVDGAAPATVLNEIAVLRRMLKLGYEHRKVAQLPRFPTIKVENARQVYFTADELNRWCRRCPKRSRHRAI